MRRALLVLLPACVLIVALSVTWIAWDHERQVAREQLQVQFDFALREAVSRVDQRMEASVQLLRGVQAMVNTADTDNRIRFQNFVSAIRLEAGFSGIQAIGINEWMPGTQKDTHVAAMKALGFKNYAVVPEGTRDNYAPIVQREPFSGRNRTQLGFDPWAEPQRRRAMIIARDSGTVGITGKVWLAVDVEGDPQPGFILYMPIFRKGPLPRDVAERRERLSGWVYASFRMNDLMASLHGEQPKGVDLSIFDGVEASAAARLYPIATAGDAPAPAILSSNEYLMVAGHPWLLNMTATEDFKSRFGRSAESLIASTGIGLSLLLTLLAWLAVTGRSRATRLAAGMTSELVASEEKFRAIADCTVNLEVWWGIDGSPRWINSSVTEYTGYTVAECMAMPDLASQLVHPEDAARVMPELQKGLKGMRGDDLEFRSVRKDGSVFWISMSWVPIRDDKGTFTGFRTSGRDISERKQAEAELRIAAVAFESREGTIVTDAKGVILRVNTAFTECTGYSAADATGQTPRMLKSGYHDAAFFRQMWDCINRDGTWQGEIWNRRKNGEVYPILMTISAVKGRDGMITHYIGTHHDITDRKKAASRIEELAFFDALTGLPNRTLLLDRLRQAMTSGQRNRKVGALLFIDLDNFKTLNDTLGHDKGDLLLQQVARRLTTCVREGDTVARFGGDEFVIVLESLDENPQEAAAETEAVATKILVSLSKTYQFGAIDHRSTASIGATLFCGQETAIDDLFKQADLAMYRAKENGRNTLRFFDPSMQTDVMERAALEADLRRAIQDSQFTLDYQAQVTGACRITGAEVLVRWLHPQRGLLRPDAFIPLAEETGLILPLGLWVLRTACMQLAMWSGQADMAHMTIAVNVSARQFREADFVETVLAVINETGADPTRLHLELTESLLVDNIADIIKKMKTLKVKGICFSLHDFGTGYSAFSYLKTLPLDQLKIDRTFVCDVLSDANAAAISQSIVTLAQSLGLSVMAEGVETQEQWNFLASSGCRAFQGDFFSRPLPVKEFEKFARRARLPSLHV
ncbi:MAG: EAL domain-containing protein [Herminiimonas sp.]|nr:EAL domain-containing protein [Herminiimonas sp.]